MTRKEIEFDTRRRMIVDATRRLLAERDIETTSMDEIAAAVDYTRRTLYAYFKSRDQILLLVLVDDLSERWKAQLAGMLDAETGLEKILTWGRTLFPIPAPAHSRFDSRPTGITEASTRTGSAGTCCKNLKY